MSAKTRSKIVVVWVGWQRAKRKRVYIPGTDIYSGIMRTALGNEFHWLEAKSKLTMGYLLDELYKKKKNGCEEI